MNCKILKLTILLILFVLTRSVFSADGLKRDIFKREGESTCCNPFHPDNLRANIWQVNYGLESKPAHYGLDLTHNATTQWVIFEDYDTTKGYPGEGWSKDHPDFRIATWNTRSLTFERFEYCKSLRYDVLAITELWRKQQQFQTRDKSFIIAEARTGEDGEKRFPKDKAAGVGILLSKAATQKVLTFGSEGERVCYVRLEGPVCNLFIVATYMSHRVRVSPGQDDTINDIHAALKHAMTKDCIIMLGDFNEQLAANLEGHTGKWTGGPPSKNSKKLVDLM